MYNGPAPAAQIGRLAHAWVDAENVDPERWRNAPSEVALPGLVSPSVAMLPIWVQILAEIYVPLSIVAAVLGAADIFCLGGAIGWPSWTPSGR